MASSGSDIYDGEIGQKFLTHLYGNFSYSGLARSEKAVVRKIQFLSEFQEKGSVSVRRKAPKASFKGGIGESMESFIRYRKDSDFSSKTLEDNRYQLRVFLTFMNSNGIDSPHSISPAHIVAFVESQKDASLTTKYNMFGAIRNFLKYLHTNYPNILEISDNIPKINYIREAKLPSIYSSEEIQSLLQVIDRGNPQGKRDYALMLIGARLGLRASDIISLTFENLHWAECLIKLKQKKTGKELELPLTSEIGDAIIDYLKHGRPISEHHYIFLSLIRPFRQMTHVSLSALTSKYLTLAGIDTSTRKHGTHVLRHSLAAELLDKKSPIHVISEILGHSSTDSTRHYLRIDTQAMKPCALQVPLVAPQFYDGVTDFFFSTQTKEEKR